MLVIRIADIRLKEICLTVLKLIFVQKPVIDCPGKNLTLRVEHLVLRNLLGCLGRGPGKICLLPH